MRPFLPVWLAAALALAPAVRAEEGEEDQAPQSESPSSDAGTGIGIIGSPLSDAGARPLRARDKKPPPTPKSAGGGGGGGGARPMSLGAARPQPEGPAAPPQPDPKCPEGHEACTRKARAAFYEPWRDHAEYNAVLRDAPCFEAALIFIKWQLWHFRRMNRVADNSNGCANVPPEEQAKILALQATNKATFDKMVALEAKGVENTCDQIVQAYRDTLPWSELALFFKGRYMTRCRAEWNVPGHKDPWIQLTACPPETAARFPRAQCSPPLPGK